MGCFSCVPVVKEQFLSGLDGSLGEDADAMVSVHHHDLSVAVRVYRVVREADLIALTSRVNYEVCNYTGNLMTSNNTFQIHKGVPFWNFS